MPEDSDYYQADTDTAPAAPKDSAAPAPKPDTKKDEEPGPETASLPKELFGDKEPEVGDVCQFKVEHIWEDEIEVSYLPEGTEPKKSTPRSAMDDATDSFDQIGTAKTQI